MSLRGAQRRKVFEQEAVDEEVSAADFLQEDEPRGVIEERDETARGVALEVEHQTQDIVLDDVEATIPEAGKPPPKQSSSHPLKKLRKKANKEAERQPDEQSCVGSIFERQDDALVGDGFFLDDPATQPTEDDSEESAQEPAWQSEKQCIAKLKAV